MNRRAFLKTLIVGVAGLAVGGARSMVPMFVGENTPHRAYVPIVVRQRKLMARIRISGDVIRASKHQPPGSFMRYALTERARINREFAAELARRGLS